MKSVNFKESNYVNGVSRPVSYELRQSTLSEDKTFEWTITCMRLSWAERLRLLFTGELWILHTNKTACPTVYKEDLIPVK